MPDKYAVSETPRLRAGRLATRGRERTPEATSFRSAAEADRLAVGLRAGLDRLAVALARVCRAFRDRRGWATFGYARLDDFAREMTGRSGRWVRQHAALGDGLERLPELRMALTGDDGGAPLGSEVATAIGRLACRHSLPRWVARARATTARRLREEIRASRLALTPWPLAPNGAQSPGSCDCLPKVRGAARAIAERKRRRRTLAEIDALAARHDHEESTGAATDRPIAAGIVTDLPIPAGSTTDLPIGARATTDLPIPAGESCRAATEMPIPAGEGRGADAEPEVGATPLADALDDHLAERRTLRLWAPVPVRAAFGETLGLHRAVIGSEVGVRSFVEALSAEGMAGDGAPEAALLAPTPGPSTAEREEALARRTDRWAELGAAVPDPEVVRGHCKELEELERLESQVGQGRAAELLDQIEALVRLEEQLRMRMGQVLLLMSETGAWPVLRFRDVGHTADERLRMSRSGAEKRVRLARRLRELDHLRRAYEHGHVGFVKAELVAQALGRGPEADAESSWVHDAMFTTVKRLRDSVSLRKRLPTAPGEHPPRHPPDDAEWLASLHRAPGRTRTRVREFGHQAAATPFADVALHLRLPEEIAESFAGTLEVRRQALEEQARFLAGNVGHSEAETFANCANQYPRSAGQAAPETSATVAGEAADDQPPASLVIAATLAAGGRPVPLWIGLLSLLEEYAETWDAPEGMRDPTGDPIHNRHGWRCAAPGCTSRSNLQRHHVIYRSQGGLDGEANEISLCAFHHLQGEHGECASVSGRPPLGLEWQLGRPAVAVRYRNERRV